MSTTTREHGGTYIVALLLTYLANLALDAGPRIGPDYVCDTIEFHATGVTCKTRWSGPSRRRMDDGGQTAPTADLTGHHDFRFASLVLGVVSLAKPALVLSSGSASPPRGLRGERDELLDGEIGCRCLGCERIAPWSLVVLQGFVGKVVWTGVYGRDLKGTGLELMMTTVSTVRAERRLWGDRARDAFGA